ncbi:MAG: T9SS type A sorting domain-containing protein [Bacteroidia bacterium]|nr:T9SS type A sorting domain-containing protein [Bacteroidia bacterium]
MKHTLLSLFFIAFTGLTLRAQTLYFEDFETTADTSLPAGWTQETLASDGGFLSGTSTSLSSSEFPIPEGTGRFIATNDDKCNTCNKSKDFVKTPYIPLDSTLTSLFLALDIYCVNGRIGAKVEKTTLEVSVDSGLTWESLGAFGASLRWEHYEVDLSRFTGNKGIMVGFKYNDAGGWLFGVCFDNIRLYLPPPNEVKLTSFTMPEYVVQGNNDISATIRNMGADTLRSLTIEYTVNDGSTQVARIDTLSIRPLGFAVLTHPTKWAISTPGNYNLKVKVSLPNDQADVDTTDNYGNASTTVATRAVQRTALVEEFTSSTCSPCSLYNQTFIPIMLEDYGANKPNSRVAAVTYHMNFPAPGNDPSFNADAGARASSYNVTQTPNLYANGQEFWDYPRTTIAKAFEKPAVMKIDLETISRNDSLVTTVTVTPYIERAAGARLFVALTEDYYEYNGYNGETEFIHAMRKMLPNPAGQTLPAMQPDVPIVFKTSYKVVAGDVKKGNYNFWGSDIVGYTTVAWVQDMGVGKHVYQAAFDEDVTVGIAPAAHEVVASFFPNPGNGQLFIRAEGGQNEPFSINIFNTTGQLVHHESLGTYPQGTQVLHTNLSHLADGMYLVQLNAGARQTTRKISISR